MSLRIDGTSRARNGRNAMLYEVGDYVFPVDLPRRVICRVEAVDRVAIQGGEMIQILTLTPLGGPWRPGTHLIRLDGAVAPANDRVKRPRPSRAALRERLAGSERWAGEPSAEERRGKVVRLRVRGLRVGGEPEASDG
jgi:hypothetical protein